MVILEKAEEEARKFRKIRTFVRIRKADLYKIIAQHCRIWLKQL